VIARLWGFASGAHQARFVIAGFQANLPATRTGLADQLNGFPLNSGLYFLRFDMNTPSSF